jgi:hypothetical protein
MAGQIVALMSCLGRLTPERRALVDKAYQQARAAGRSDREAADVALALLTDDEKASVDAEPVGRATRTSRSASR